ISSPNASPCQSEINLSSERISFLEKSKGKIIHISISDLVIVSTERSQIELKQSHSINKPGFFSEKMAVSNYFF
ncbi:hypothetical protein, partial [Microcoleus sp. herbarium12]|uniref:hypothetical protein n=1 Tax=Microcoleus sp. herbarium12 TaxID=3055437 RepID=UPI002FD55D74